MLPIPPFSPGDKMALMSFDGKTNELIIAGKGEKRHLAVLYYRKGLVSLVPRPSRGHTSMAKIVDYFYHRPVTYDPTSKTSKENLSEDDLKYLAEKINVMPKAERLVSKWKEKNEAKYEKIVSAICIRRTEKFAERAEVVKKCQQKDEQTELIKWVIEEHKKVCKVKEKTEIIENEEPNDDEKHFSKSLPDNLMLCSVATKEESEYKEESISRHPPRIVKLGDRTITLRRLGEPEERQIPIEPKCSQESLSINSTKKSSGNLVTSSKSSGNLMDLIKRRFSKSKASHEQLRDGSQEPASDS